MDDLKKSILDECNDKKKYKNPKDRKAVFDDFLDGFDSSDWKNYFKYKGNSKAEIRKLKLNCLVKSSVTENLLEGTDIVPKSKDFYTVYLDYFGWKNFTQKKSKNRNYKNIRSKIPKYLTDYIPQIEEDEIEGRTEELKKTHNLLSNKKKAVVVNALGGIGKTTLASVYVTKYSSEYKHIVWINQSSIGTFKNDFVYTAGLLKRLNILVENLGKDLEEIYSNIINELDSIEDEPCLMVIDNADEGLSNFRNILPKKPKWHILVTSREKIPLFKEVINLDFLSLEDAVKLYKRNYEREDIEDTTIQEIVKCLDFHTLTIEILARTAKKRDQMPASILEFLKKNMLADLNIRHNKEASSQKIERVTNYLCKIFNNIEELTDDNKWLLQQLSCLPPEYHNYKNVLKELLTKEEFDLRENLENLSERGWLQHNPKKDDYKLHRIVIVVVHKSLPVNVERIKPLLSAIYSKLPVAWDKVNPIDKFNWIPFGKNILNLFKTEKDSKILEINELQNNLALALKEFGGKDNLEEAKYWLEKVKDSDCENYGEKHPKTAVSYSNLALVLKDFEGRDNLQESRFWLEKAKDSAEEHYGEEHPTMAIYYSNLGTVLKSLGGKDNLEEAKYWLEKAVILNLDNYGKKHPQTAMSYSNLAIVHMEIGEKDNLQKSKYWFEMTKDSNFENYGEKHPITALSYGNLAAILRNIGGKDNLEEAKYWLEKSLKIFEISHGEEHLKVKEIRFNLEDIIYLLNRKN